MAKFKAAKLPIKIEAECDVWLKDAEKNLANAFKFLMSREPKQPTRRFLNQLQEYGVTLFFIGEIVFVVNDIGWRTGYETFYKIAAYHGDFLLCTAEFSENDA